MTYTFGDNYRYENLWRYRWFKNEAPFLTNGLMMIAGVLFAILVFVSSQFIDAIRSEYVLVALFSVFMLFAFCLFILKMVRNRQVDCALLAVIMAFSFVITTFCTSIAHAKVIEATYQMLN